MGNVENHDDIVSACYERIVVVASFPHVYAQDEVSYIKAVRSINGGDPIHATPFSRMATTNNDMEDVPFDDEVVAEDTVEQFSLDDVMHDVLVELESVDLDSLVQRELSAALEEGNVDASRLSLLHGTSI